MRIEGGVFTGRGEDRSGAEHRQNGIEGGESTGIADFERDNCGLGYPSHGSKRPLRQFLALSEDGYLLADGISGGEIPTTKRPPEGIESLGPGGEVPEASFELSDGGKRDTRGGGHRGLGETAPVAEFPELHSETILEQFIYQSTGERFPERNRFFTFFARENFASR